MTHSPHSAEHFAGHQVYFRIILLGLLLHISQTIMYAFLHCPIFAAYNIFSVMFYCMMQLVIKKRMYRTAVTCIHIEVCLFTITGCFLCGWETGLPLYLMAISSLVYFCPFENKYIPYLFSAAEAVVFIVLILSTKGRTPYYSHISDSAAIWILVYSTVCCFGIIFFAALFSNITASVTNQKLRDENENLAALANYDYLTGLLSRRAFQERLDEASLDASIIIAMGDLDDFKRINDTYGHPAGDYVLRTISQLIVKTCSLRTIPCRWGGEEFIFLFRGTSLSQASEEMHLLKEAVASYPFCYDGKSFQLTITLAFSESKSGQSAEALIKQVDTLLYQGKSQGKNCIIY